MQFQKKKCMHGKRNSCKACASEKQILQTSGLKKIHAPKFFIPPPVICNGPSLKKLLAMCSLSAELMLTSFYLPVHDHDGRS